MIGKLLATTALLLVITGTASAQSTGSILATGYQMTQDDTLASKLIGSTVYSTLASNNNAPAATTTDNKAASTGKAAPAAEQAATNGKPAVAANSGGMAATTAGDTNAQQIGTVRDLVMEPDGKVAAVVIGVGGFLGMGEKNVAVAYSDLHWAAAQDGSLRGMLDTTADALKAAPDFNYADAAGVAAAKAPANPAPAPAGTANAAPGGAMTAAPAATTTVAAAPADKSTAPAATAAKGADVDVAKLKPSDMQTMKADDIKGADVLDPSGNKIASVNDVVLTKDGKVDAVIVDFGGFLGIGTKQIALGFEGLRFMDDASNKRYLVVNVTKEQLDAAKAYNKDDYASNRDAERLVVTN